MYHRGYMYMYFRPHVPRWNFTTYLIGIHVFNCINTLHVFHISDISYFMCPHGWGQVYPHIVGHGVSPLIVG